MSFYNYCLRYLLWLCPYSYALIVVGTIIHSLPGQPLLKRCIYCKNMEWKSHNWGPPFTFGKELLVGSWWISAVLNHMTSLFRATLRKWRSWTPTTYICMAVECRCTLLLNSIPCFIMEAKRWCVADIRHAGVFKRVSGRWCRFSAVMFRHRWHYW